MNGVRGRNESEEWKSPWLGKWCHVESYRRTRQFNISFSTNESDLQIGNFITNMVGRTMNPKISKEMIRKYPVTQMSSSPQAKVNNILLCRGRCGQGVLEDLGVCGGEGCG